MLAFNHEAFLAVSAKCKGQNSKHKHAAWGLDQKKKKKFATSEETAYPMGLAKLLANCIAMALITLGIKAPEETVCGKYYHMYIRLPPYSLAQGSRKKVLHLLSALGCLTCQTGYQP